MASFLRRILLPLRKAWSFSLDRLRRHRRAGRDFAKLYYHVQSCGYEDVHVMWSILQQSQVVDASKAQREDRLGSDVASIQWKGAISFCSPPPCQQMGVLENLPSVLCHITEGGERLWFLMFQRKLSMWSSRIFNHKLITPMYKAPFLLTYTWQCLSTFVQVWELWLCQDS